MDHSASPVSKSFAWRAAALRLTHVFQLGFAALGAGARSIPLGDNGEVLRALAARCAEAKRCS